MPRTVPVAALWTGEKTKKTAFSKSDFPGPWGTWMEMSKTWKSVSPARTKALRRLSQTDIPPLAPRRSASDEGDLLQELQVVEHLARPEDDGRQRVLGDEDGQLGLLADPLIQVLEQRAAAGQDDAPVDDVRRELGRRPLQGDADGVDDGRDRLF